VVSIVNGIIGPRENMGGERERRDERWKDTQKRSAAGPTNVNLASLGESGQVGNLAF